MRSRVVTAVQVAFETWYRTFRSENSSTDSSSAPHTSYLDGCYQHVCSSGPPGIHRLSTNSQAFSMDTLGSPTGSSMMKPRRSQRDNGVLDPRFMAPPPRFDLNAMGAGLSTEHRAHAGYPVDTLNTFVGDPFTDNTLEAGADQYYMDYDAPGAHFNDANAATRAAFASPTGGINPNQTFMNSSVNPTHHNMTGYSQSNWSHPYSGPGRSHYAGGQP